MDMGHHFIHAVGWWANDDLIFAGCAKNAQGEVNHFITAISDEDIFYFNFLNTADSCFDRLLMRIGIPVEHAEGVFIGIKKDAFSAVVFIPGAGIALK